MLIALQVPLVDVRTLLTQETGRVSAPSWPIPDINQPQFVRGFGRTQRRPRGEVEGLIGEGFFAKTTGVIRFDQLELTSRLGAFGHVQPAYRRMFCDGRAIARVEIGFAFRPKANHALPGGFLETLLAAKVRVRRMAPGGPAESEPTFARMGPALARSFLSATTRRKPVPPPAAESWWVSAGEPVIFVERVRAKGEVVEAGVLPGLDGYLAELDGVPVSSTRLSHELCTMHGQSFSVWTLSCDQFIGTRTGRRVRGHILRLQAELETLRRVIRLVQSKQLQADASPASPLANLLGDASKLLQTDERGGFPQGEVFGHLAATAAVLPIESRNELRELVGSLRTTVKADFTKLIDSHLGSLVLSVQTLAVTGDVIMTTENKTINIGAGATINAPVTVADTIQGSFNTLKDSNADAEVKAATEELLKAVAEVSKSVPEADARKMAKNAEALAKEVASPEPDKEWYKVSLEGLKKAAENVGAVAAPVLTTALKLAKLLL